MFTISLLQTNGSRKGRRSPIGTSPTVLGRSENCEIALRSRSVSRKHCVLIFNETDVLIRDLGSRNGTYVNQQKLTKGITRSLSHHDEIRVGKYTFRISVRDSETRRPHRTKLIDTSTVSGPAVFPADQHKGTTQLLSELDDLAAKLGTNHETPPSVFSTKSTASTDHEDTSVGNAAANVETESESPTGLTENQPGKNKSDSFEASENLNEDEDPDDPNKLPDHLRPKGPKDSQSAAETALRNLFTR